MSKFADASIVITGASRGLGEEFAVQFARRRARLILCARSAQDLAATADRAKGAGAKSVACVVADLSTETGVQVLIDAVQRETGVPDVLVNNAGFGSYGKWHTLDLDREMRMIRLNVDACLRLVHRWLPGMIERKSGWILNVASLGGMMPMPYGATYGATKAFLLSWSEALWVETRKTGVHVMALCPGPVPTHFAEAAGIPSQTENPIRIDAEQCVATAIAALEDRRSHVVPGFLARATSWLVRFLPRALIAKGAGEQIRKRVGV